MPQVRCYRMPGQMPGRMPGRMRDRMRDRMRNRDPACQLLAAWVFWLRRHLTAPSACAVCLRRLAARVLCLRRLRCLSALSVCAVCLRRLPARVI